MGINAEKSLYRQYENLLSKMDELLKSQREDKEQIKELNKTIVTQGELNAKLLLEIERLKNQINKDSSNSSKPGSSDNNNKPPKSGANMYNGRVKTSKSIGGQLGHKGNNLSQIAIEKMIDNNEIIVKEVKHTIKGSRTKTPLIKYKVGIEVIPYVEKHIFCYDELSEEELPKEFYTDVTYNSYLKSMCVELGSYNVVAIDRLSDFISVITNGLINISNGSICNFFSEFSNLSLSQIEKLEEEILSSNLIYTDETGTKLNKKKMYFRNYSTDNIAIYKYNNKKGHNSIKENNILPRFVGGIMGDHDTALYSYGTDNYECNVHVGRYLEELIQNIPYVSWSLEMKDLFYRIHNSINIAKLYKVDSFDESKIVEYIKEYDLILEKAKEENITIKSSFYKGKAKKLLNRLTKYKDNHLYFVKDFNVPFSNNTSEQDLRVLKTKTKVSGGFRSEKGACSYANTLTIIKTAKKRGINPFSAILNIFNNKPCFSS